MNAWVLAARPKTLWAAVGPVAIGVGMAYGDRLHHWPSALACLVCALLIQIATNFWNDYADFRKGADTSERTGPTRATQSGLVTPPAMRNAALLTFAAATAFSIYLVARAGWPLAAIGGASILSGILYTGGPRPLGYLGLGDVFVLIFFGPVAVAGTYYAQALRVTSDVIFAGLAPGLLSTAVLVVNNLRDRETDAKAGKRTLAVRFGERFAQAEYFFCIAGASFVPFALYMKTGRHVNSLAASATILAALPAVRAVFTRKGKALNPILGYTALLLLLYSFLFVVGWLL
jgi:1,4-dihydroxy-2-naphthoate polyprenyltransferase